jgi:hypothetical protein
VPGFLRETANADDDKLTREAHKAIVAQEVARETAAAETRIAELTKQVADLQSSNDVLETEKASALAATEQVQAAFDAYKVEQERAAEVTARTDERVKKINEVAPSLDISPERAARYAAMSDEDFGFHLGELERAAAQGPHAWKTGSEDGNCASCGNGKDAPMHQAAEKAAVAAGFRETAMVGIVPKPPAAGGFAGGQSALRNFALGSFGQSAPAATN